MQKISSSVIIFTLLIMLLQVTSIQVETTQAQETEYFLYVNLVGSGSVTYNGTGVYDPGDVVEITATPAVGWEFSGWSGDLGGSAVPEYLTMDSNKTVTATFTEIPEVHDVEAVSQIVTENEVMPGDLVDIDVTVRNNGLSNENFDVTLYYDNVKIGTILVVDLAPGEVRVLTFTWDTTGLPLNGYPITAWADSGEVIAEVDEQNNWCTMPCKVFVVPELPLGTILASLSMFIALVGYVGFRRYRTK
jgi:subtilase family serine protease